MDITILLIVIIFVLLVVLITGTAIFMLHVYRKAKHASIVADTLRDEQISADRAIADLEAKVSNLSAPVPAPAYDPNSREEQFARMMAMRPPAGLKLDDIGGDGQ